MDPLLGETTTDPGAPAAATPAGGSSRISPTARAEFHELRFHAAGALGEVFMARNAELNREVALKFLKPERSKDPDSLRRFLQEAEVTGRLEHPGVVPIYALGTDAAGAPCYAMRFIRGETLQDRVDAFHAAEKTNRDLSERSLALRELLNRFVSICSTMAYAHSRGILHRDLKPRNVMLGKYDETLVVDWGLAKPFDRDETARSVGEETLMPNSGSGNSGSDTPTVGVVGTPAYMSPEQGEAEWEIVGPASDIFGLGAILYAILTGRPPYQGRTTREILEKVRRCEYPGPRQIKPGVSRALESVCVKAMAAKPEDRYATAMELATDIRRWLADEPVSAWREPLWIRARRWSRKHRIAVSVVAACLLTATLFLWVGSVRAERHAQTVANYENVAETLVEIIDVMAQREEPADTVRPIPQQERIGEPGAGVGGV
jgi:eukaryotic-like serine/threonine-protein kinase